MNVKILKFPFTECYRSQGWPTGLLLLCVLLVGLQLGGCGSGSASSAVASTDTGPGAQPAVDVAALIQIVPAPTPAFDPAIHDYVIDCNPTGSVDLTATNASDYGFAYLGTTQQPTYVAATGFQTSLRQTVQMKPGQRFRFFIASTGTYSVRCAPSDLPKLTVSINGTPQAEWYVFAPDINASGFNGGNYVVITDAHGTPVWWLAEAGQTIVDAKVLDSNHIAWTRFSNAGTYDIRTLDGQLANTLTGGLDIHDLQPTANGTYLTLRYVQRVCPPDCADLSPWGGKAQVAAVDAEILEIDANSNILWIWKTRDHIALSETGDTGWVPSVGTDIIHMNSVEPDGTDAVLFTARHLNAAYRVIKSTGAIDWKLGGTARPESLTVVGDVRPTATGPYVLVGLHDIRKWSDGTISVHDNGTLIGREPWVMRYSIDVTNRVAQVVQAISDSRVTGSGCCGSARLLPGGNWVIQWGAAPFMTELDSSGNPVMTVQYNLGATFSYRAVPVLPGVVSGLTLRKGMDSMYD